MPRPTRPYLLPKVAVWGLVVISVVAVMGGMLAPYRSGPPVPLGADSPHHIWRMRLVAAEGLDALPDFRGSHLLNANGDRPGLPVLAAIVASSGGPGGTAIGFTLPAVLAAVIALGAIAVARRGACEPGLAVPLYALAAGASLPVVFASNGPYEQLLALGLLVPAIAAASGAARGDRRGAIAAVVLLGGAWASHWMVTGAAVGSMVLAVTMWCLMPVGDPDARARRGRVARRLLTVAGGAALLAGVVTVLAPALPQPPLGVTAEGIRDNLGRQLPAYTGSLLGPIAVAGAVALGLTLRPPRASLVLLVGWASIPLVGGLMALSASDVPLHRFLSVTLAPPLLAAAGATGLARAVRGGGGRARSVAGAAAALAVVATLSLQAWSVWASRPPGTGDTVAAQLEAIGAALAGYDRPVVLVVWDLPGPGGEAAEDFGTVRALRRIRAAMPERLISRTVVYLGHVDTLLQGRPTMLPDAPGFDAVSLDAWRAVEPFVDDDPVIMVYAPWADTFADEAAAHPAWVVNGWLLSSDPTVAVPQEAPVMEAPPLGRLGVWSVGIVVLLGAIGLGWSVALGRGDALVVAGLAPGLGLALVVLLGVAAEAAGIRVGGAGWVLALLVGAMGWAAALLTRGSGELALDDDLERFPP